MKLPDDVFETLKAERAKYGVTVPVEGLGIILNTVTAKYDGWGLLRKPGGFHTIQPVTQIPVSVDILLYKPAKLWWDVLVDAGSTAVPTQGDGEPAGLNPDGTIAGFVEPVPTEYPLPPPPVDTLTPRVERLEQAVMLVAQEMNLLRGELEILTRAVQSLTQATPRKGDEIVVTGRVSLFGTSRLTGKL